jgi:hypothetical protein
MRYIIYILLFIVAILVYFLYIFTIGSDIEADKTPITPFQQKHLILLFVSSVVTSFALVIALLKEEIIGLWKYANLSVIGYRLSEDKEKQSSSDIKAKKYEVIIEILNSGSIPAKDCSVVITNLDYKLGSSVSNPLDPFLFEELNWRGKNIPKIYITSNNGIAQVSLIEIIPNISSTSKEGQSEPNTLQIAGVDVTKENKAQVGSEWTIFFMICSENCRLKKYKMVFAWNGKWENRLEEMKQWANVKTLTIDRKKWLPSRRKK